MAESLVFSQEGVEIYELLGSGDCDRLDAMLALYAQYFSEYAHYVPRMRRRAQHPSEKREGQVAHYWLFEYEGKPVGLTTFRYIVKRECGLGVSFAVDTAARSICVNNQRFSAFVISQIMKQLKKDAARTDTGLYGLVTEVEHRSLMEHYKKMGMLELPMQYFEPVYPPENGDNLQSRIEKITFIPVILAVIPNGGFALNKPMLTNFTEAFLIDHYELSKSHPMVKKMLDFTLN